MVGEHLLHIVIQPNKLVIVVWTVHVPTAKVMCATDLRRNAVSMGVGNHTIPMHSAGTDQAVAMPYEAVSMTNKAFFMDVHLARAASYSSQCNRSACAASGTNLFAHAHFPRAAMDTARAIARVIAELIQCTALFPSTICTA
jgi:hypothetical protein